MMADYKLDKRGRKYKAHRHTMGKANPYPTAKEIAAAMRKGPSTDAQESFNPYEEMILSEADNVSKEKKKKQDQQPQPTNTQSDRTKQEPKAPEREKNVGDRFGDIIMKGLKLVGGRDMDEEQQVDEVSKATMANYISKAAKDVGYEANLTGFKAGQKTKGYNPTDETPRETKRHKGIARALKKLTGVKVSEEVEQVDEISKATAQSYMNKRTDPVYGIPRTSNKKSLSTIMKSLDTAHKRVTGRKPTSEEVEDVEEARFSGKRMGTDFVYNRKHDPEDEDVSKLNVEPKDPYYKAKMERLRKGLADLHKTTFSHVKEEEQLAEISKGLATRYVQKKVSQMAKRDSLHTDKDVKNLSRAYKRMAEENIQEAAVVKVATNPDGTKTVTVKTDTGKLVNHTYNKSSSINKLLKRRYGITGSL